MMIKERSINHAVYKTCIENRYPEIAARIIAARTDNFDKNIFEFTIDAVKPADTMADCTKAAKRIAEAINNNETILLFTDYDVDGCSSMAVLYGTLHDVFQVPESKIIKLTGHRTTDGYGLTDPVADKILEVRPNLVITADAGASDGNRITRLADASIDVIVTDHHLIPKEGVPDAAFAVVNPQRENCTYDSSIAGCGVAWLLMTALSKEMKCSIEQKQKIHQMLDYVALGTVADLVPLTSVINRYFVKKGLEFMNRKNRRCWQAALNEREADAEYLAFQLAPRINASSRITGEASTAVDFLIEHKDSDAFQTYQQLENFNNSRQQIEKKMFNEAKEAFYEITNRAKNSVGSTKNNSDQSSSGESKINSNENKSPSILIYYSGQNHAGIQGIVAGKITETFGIPSIMLADVGDGVITGSCRAGQFLHIRDALQTFDDSFPNILIAYGGHKAAAGFKIYKKDFELFKNEMQNIVSDQLKEKDTTPYILTDGSLNNNLNQISLETYYHIEALKPFGIGFPAPLFYDRMKVSDVKVMGKYPVHLSMVLDNFRAAFFYALDKPNAPLPVKSGDIVDVVYTLSLNSWQGMNYLQLIVKKIQVV